MMRGNLMRREVWCFEVIGSVLRTSLVNWLEFAN